jgi:DivIVA domain-containing protein
MTTEREPPGPDEERPESAPGEYVGPARPISRNEPRPEPPPEPITEEHAGPVRPVEDEPASRPAPEAPPGGGPPAPARPPLPPQRPPAREQAPPPPVRQPPRRRQPAARRAAERARAPEFPVVLRGYDRAAVDAYVEEVLQLLAELEGRQLPETVVQRALDDIGEETSEILKRAHAAAEEIGARARSQADGRIQRAEREAELLRRDAEEQAGRLEADTRALWQERRRLIDDLRQLADDVLAVSDDALDRMEPPDETTVGASDEADTGGDLPGTPDEGEEPEVDQGPEAAPGSAEFEAQEPPSGEGGVRRPPPGTSAPGGSSPGG